MPGTSAVSRWLSAVAVLLALIMAGPGQSAPILKSDDDALRERALKLNDITGDDPILGQIVTLIEDKENTKKLLVVALKMAKEKEQPLNVNATYMLARVAQRLKETEAAEHFYKVNAEQSLKLGSSQKFVRAFTGRIDMLYAANKYKDAETVCKEFLEIRGDDNIQRFKMLVLRRMVQTQAKQGKTDEALTIVENLIKAQPENWLTHELKGWVLREAGKFDEAAKIYEDVLDKIGKDERLDKEQKDDFGGDIRYTLSGVYVDLKKIDKAADHLKVLLEKDKNNPTFNNDLGFIWADHNMNLEEAEKLVRKAIDEDKKQRHKNNPNIKPADDKDNPAYLDSLGWVLYKKKQFKEALPPLLEAVKSEDGQHMEIYDHLGEVYLALKETDKAVDAWKKGLACPPVSKRDNARKGELEKKVKAAEEKK